MKKFKFNLEALLKLREFSEKQRKLELGQILREIVKINDDIERLRGDISETYTAQEDFMSSPASGQMIRFFPLFIKNKEDEIKNKQTLLYSLHKKKESKSKDLALARGEAKVIEKLKEKHHYEHKKKILKEESNNLEEYVMIKRHREKNL